MKMPREYAVFIAWISLGSRVFPHSGLQAEADKLSSQLQFFRIASKLIKLGQSAQWTRLIIFHRALEPLLLKFRFGRRSVRNFSLPAKRPQPGAIHPVS